LRLPAWSAAVASTATAAISTTTAASPTPAAAWPSATATTSATATAAEATTTAAATATESAALRLGTRFVHRQLPSVESASVQLRHGRIRLGIIRHLDKRKSAGLAAVAITNDIHLVHCAKLRECRAQTLFVCMETHIAYVNVFHENLFKCSSIEFNALTARQAVQTERKRYTGREQIAGLGC
jgi:hypothetical protein